MRNGWELGAGESYAETCGRGKQAAQPGVTHCRRHRSRLRRYHQLGITGPVPEQTIWRTLVQQVTQIRLEAGSAMAGDLGPETRLYCGAADCGSGTREQREYND